MTMYPLYRSGHPHRVIYRGWQLRHPILSITHASMRARISATTRVAVRVPLNIGSTRTGTEGGALTFPPRTGWALYRSNFRRFLSRLWVVMTISTIPQWGMAAGFGRRCEHMDYQTAPRAHVYFGPGHRGATMSKFYYCRVIWLMSIELVLDRMP